MLTYANVRSASRQGFFLVLHPNGGVQRISVSPAICIVKALPQCDHVRFGTLPFVEGAFSRSSSKWRRSVNSFRVDRITASKPMAQMLTYANVRSASQQGFFLVLHPNGGVQRISSRSVPEHDASHSETESRAAKPNFHRGCLAPALESRGADLRPRKLDGKLIRDVARARRVALLAPRATLN